jgi:hypothetical protein
MSTMPVPATLAALLVAIPVVMAVGAKVAAGAAATGGGGGGARRLGDVVVEAGPIDRHNTVVIFTLPPDIQAQARPLALKDRKGARHPIQIDDQGRAVFILKSLKRGSSETFALEARDAGPRPGARAGVEARREADGVVFLVGGKQALRYQSTARQPPAGVAAEYQRGGYIHPVFTPGGVMVTDDYPTDHRHHHGIWAAWTETEFDGRKPDFWNMGKKTGRVDFESLDATWDGPVFAGLRARHVYSDLGGGKKKTALHDDWHVMVYRTHAEGEPPYYLFDVDSTQTAADLPLTLTQYRYGGMSMRGHADWNGKGKATFTTSEGKNRLDGNATTGRWCHMGGTTKEAARSKDGTAGLTIFGHPQNFRAPQPMRIHPDNPFFNYAPSQAGTFTIKPGTPFVARHRFLVADGPADTKLLERVWTDYAQPPQVQVTVAKK